MMKNKISQFLFVLFVVIATACSHAPTASKIGDEHIDVQPVTKARSEIIPPYAQKVDPSKCTCIQMWMPVCGENGRTYSNACFAQCAGVKYKQGSCQKDLSD